MSISGVLGSGFGVYGWLPALASAKPGDIALPSRYRATFAARPELAAYAARIRWLADDDAVMAASSTLVLAQRPGDQLLRVAQCLAAGPSALFLEKPVTPSPDQALAMHRSLMSAGVRFEIGYSFLYTGWGRNLLARLGGDGADGSLVIGWRFKAHHYRHQVINWKRRTSEGGGALRFFGIQLIALLAFAGYTQAPRSTTWGDSDNDCRGWQASLHGPGLPPCSIIVDSCWEGEPALELGLTAQGVAPLTLRQDGPFGSGTPQAGLPDPRIGLLESIVRLDAAGAPGRQHGYAATLTLWQRIEQANIHHTDCNAPYRSPHAT